MTPSDISILVVDDTKFSVTIITKNLISGGFSNVRHINSAQGALDIQKQEPANIVIANWLMPEMDGLEMTKRIRQMDKALNRYTYIIMLTAKDSIDALKHAFDEGVDDFVSKAMMQQQLLPRVYAAERLVNNQNSMLRQHKALLQEKRHLETLNHKLKGLCTIDSLTGLGNRTYAKNKLEDNLKHTAARGGATCVMLLRFNDIKQLQKELPASIFQELIIGISLRIKSLVRPLDDISRIDKYSFIIVTHQPNIDICIGKNFKRIADSLNNRTFQTSIGFKQATFDMGIAAADGVEGLPTPDMMLRIAERAMKKALHSHQIEHLHYNLDLPQC